MSDEEKLDLNICLDSVKRIFKGMEPEDLKELTFENKVPISEIHEKRKVENEGIMREVKKRRYYLKPSEAKKVKRAAAA